MRHLLVGLAEHVEAEGILGLAHSAAGSTVSTLSRAISSSEFGDAGEDGGPPPVGAAPSGGSPPAENGREKCAVEVTGLEELLRVPDPASLASRDHRARGLDDGSSLGEDSFRDALWRLEPDDCTHRDEVWFDAVDSPIPTGYAPYDDEDGNEAFRVGSWSESLEPWLAGDEAERGPSAQHEAEERDDNEGEEGEEAYWMDLRCLADGFRGEDRPPPNGHHYALDDGCPSFRSVLDAAASLALDVLGPGSAEWQPDGDTARALAAADRGDGDCADRPTDAEVLKWTGTHGGRSVLKSRGVVRMSPRDLLSVLLDPDRATEYNTNCAGKVCLRKFNLGKIDDDDDDDDEPTATTASIVRSSIRVPVIGAGIDTMCLVHSRPVEEGTGGSPSYVLVSVAAAQGPAGGDGGGGDGLVAASVLRPTPPVVRRDGAAAAAEDEEWCELTNVARAALPVPVPGFLLRRAAEAGADSFFSGVRDLADRERAG